MCIYKIIYILLLIQVAVPRITPSRMSLTSRGLGTVRPLATSHPHGVI